MNYSLHILLAAAILAHALFGCCAHESHAGSDASCVHAVGVHESGHHHDHAGEVSHEQSALGADDCDHEPQPAVPHACQHQNCLWTVGDLDGFDLSLQGTYLSLCVDSLAISPLSFDQLAAFLAVDRHTVAPALPVRSHLALSILLI